MPPTVIWETALSAIIIVCDFSKMTENFGETIPPCAPDTTSLLGGQQEEEGQTRQEEAQDGV